MNKDYNKHREIAIVLFMIVAVILVACNMDRNKANHTAFNLGYDTCGIDSVYITDSLHQTYDEVKVDTQGHIYHITIK